MSPFYQDKEISQRKNGVSRDARVLTETGGFTHFFLGQEF
jgi:hypothetical protein